MVVGVGGVGGVFSVVGVVCWAVGGEWIGAPLGVLFWGFSVVGFGGLLGGGGLGGGCLGVGFGGGGWGGLRGGGGGGLFGADEGGGRGLTGNDTPSSKTKHAPFRAPPWWRPPMPAPAAGTSGTFQGRGRGCLGVGSLGVCIGGGGVEGGFDEALQAAKRGAEAWLLGGGGMSRLLHGPRPAGSCAKRAALQDAGGPWPEGL